MSDMKIVVTGSSGYVGTELVGRLGRDPSCRVVAIDRVEPAVELPSNAVYVPCDLSKPGATLDGPEFDGIDAVIHLAAARGDWAISDREYWRDNVEATRGLIEARWAPSVPRWVLMSSVSTYGPSDVPLDEAATCRPIGPYGESKLASEVLFRAFVDQHKVLGCVIRPSAIFSPGHPPNTNVYRLIETLRRWPIPLIGGGENRKTLTYLPNLLDLVFWCLDRMHKEAGRVSTYNCVEEPVQTVAELIETLRDAGIRPARVLSIPRSAALACSYPVHALARLIHVDLKISPERVRKYAAHTWYDATKAKRDGYRPAVALRQALRDTAAWHLDRARADRGSR